jgi:hypothetical protein
MKFDLKNRPKHCALPKAHEKYGEQDVFISEYEEWFQGFAKELREKRASIEQFKKKNEKHRRFHEYPNGMLDMITEVLGVEPKVKEETEK